MQLSNVYYANFDKRAHLAELGPDWIDLASLEDDLDQDWIESLAFGS